MVARIGRRAVVGLEGLAAARQAVLSMNSLFVTAFTPSIGSGRGVRTFGVVAALARHDPVEVAYVRFGGDRVAAEYEALPDVTMSPLLASRGIRRGLSYVRARSRGVPSALARGVSAELGRKATSAGADVRVIADGPVVAGALLGLARRREVVYLAHNLESGFRTEFGAGDLATFERDVLRTFSESWMATRADASANGGAAGGDHVHARYVPNVVDVARIVPVEPSGQGRLLLVADFTYEPNREGLRFLTEEVSSRAVSAAGGTASRRWTWLSEPPADARIEAAGFVENLQAAYAGCDAVLVPLLHGGGSPLKFIEGLAYGLPTIATTHAARLLEDGVAGEHFFAGRRFDEFAAAIEVAIADRVSAAAVGAAGRGLVECVSSMLSATLLVD